MNNRLVLLGMAIFAFGAMTGYFIAPKNGGQEALPPPPLPLTPPAITATIIYENNSFNPKTITVKAGDIVEFVNKSNGTLRVASNPHPFHSSYPELDSSNLQPGATYQISFPEAMTITYHNHFNPGANGTIGVK